MARYHSEHHKHHEHLFGEMLNSVQNEHANMPQEVIMKAYPRDTDPAIAYDLNDGPSGVDKQIRGDKEKVVKGHGHMHEL
jgi:hypothetical protein